MEDEGAEDEAHAREELGRVRRAEDEERGEKGEHHPVAGRGPEAGERLPEGEGGHGRPRALSGREWCAGRSRGVRFPAPALSRAALLDQEVGEGMGRDPCPPGTRGRCRAGSG